MAFWQWDESTRRYRITSDGARALNQPSGSFVGQVKMLGFRDELIAQQKQRAVSLASDLSSGSLSIQDWLISMRKETKDTYLSQYMLGRGGRNAMTQADYGRVGRQIRDQYSFLQNFAERIADGKYSERQISAISQLYIEGSSSAFEIGNARAHGSLSLPQHPGDGKTQCLTNCKCHWQIRDTGGAWSCVWVLNVAEHCPDCLANASKWSGGNPLVIEK